MLEDIELLDHLAGIRTNDFSEPIDLYLKAAEQLEATYKYNYITRAKFIREQCNGKSSKEIFDKYREDWEIWDFKENLITVNDFKRGFLWCFRDHTTSWCDNQKAKTWFLTSPEALFVRRYEFWTWDNGKDECIEVKEGSYKEILVSLLKDQDYEVLSSPIFSKTELTDFIKNYEHQTGDFTIEEIIEDYIESNPNYTEAPPTHDD
jgi:hypothetical protein